MRSGLSVLGTATQAIIYRRRRRITENRIIYQSNLAELGYLAVRAPTETAIGIEAGQSRLASYSSGTSVHPRG
jgi:hypothetical protein